MKKDYRINILIFAVLVCSFFSCSTDNYELEQQLCEVSINGLQRDFAAVESELKSTSVNRGNAPSSVQGYNLRVENLDNPEVGIIQEQFTFNGNWQDGNGIVRHIREGRNKFTATSFGGTTHKGWKNIWKVNWGDLNYRSSFYSNILKNSYPIYTVYKDEITREITFNGDNNVRFEMLPVNGRLAIVIENNKKNYAFGVSINGSWKALYGNQIICYLINDNTQSGTIYVDIAFYKLKNNRYYYKKTERRSFTIDAGKNKTRVIEMK